MVRKLLFGALGTLIAGLLVAIGVLGHMVFADPSSARVLDAAASKANASNADAVDRDFALLHEIAKVLGQDFVQANQAGATVLRDGAIRGIFEALKDPHSFYADPDEHALQKRDFEGTFEGIGATVQKLDDFLVIVQPMPDSPAEKAGLKPGDVILSVDGESAKGWTVEKGVPRIRGVAGSTVRLAVRHSDGKEETLSIRRASIKQASVGTRPPGANGKLIDSSGTEATDYAYIQIRSFTRSTPDEVRKAIEAAHRANARGIILDVRGNPGGYLTETVEIADMFLDKGEIYSQVDRAGNRETATADRAVLTSLPVAVLQDQFSASGAELLAAALKENGRATIVGTRSFGKGTVNHLRELSNGGAVYVSIARWLTPARNQIEGQGVRPNIEVQATQDDIQAHRDIWVHRAIDALRAGGR